MAEIRIGEMQNPESRTAERILCDETGWVVECTAECAKRMDGWRGHKVITPLLEAARNISGILAPLDLPNTLPTDRRFPVKSPVKKDGWFSAETLHTTEDVHKNRLTVPAFWTLLSHLCDILSDLYALGIWGYLDRSHVLLRSPDKISGAGNDQDYEILLSGMEYLQIFQEPQLGHRLSCGMENAATTAFRVLIGSAALCVPSNDIHNLLQVEADPLIDGGNPFRSPLEQQLGWKCTGALHDFFYTPSHHDPTLFLCVAREKLLDAARQICLALGPDRNPMPQRIHLYLVLLGGSCHKEEIPALSAAARAFYYSLDELREKRGIPQYALSCIFPWGGVQVRQVLRVIPTISTLNTELPELYDVPLGGVLDCLNRLIQESIDEGAAPLVCYIALSRYTQMNFLDQSMMRELANKNKHRVFEAIFCGATLQGLQQDVLHTYDDLLSGRLQDNAIADNWKSLCKIMLRSLNRLLDMPRYYVREEWEEEE